MDRIGRYKIVRELGRGAMGIVYHAIDPNIGRPVAIKTIQFAPTRKPEEMERMRERLFREARSAGNLSHPGIVTIYDVDQQGDLAYIAMEYVDGSTLEHILSEAPGIAPDRMFSILGQTAVALDYAHSKGIVHRDIKPANIMVTADGTSKITDFGIAKVTTSEQLTRTGSIVGTPHYMSPEQVQGQTVDGRSDQFSLAVIAYEMLTGEKPYTGEHLTTVVYKIVAEEPVPPRRLNPSLSLAIEAALRKGLAKRPDNRYRTCQEFASALESACTSSAGWKLMPRSGMLNEPTIVDAAQAPARAQSQPSKTTLPTPHRQRRSEGTSTSASPRKKAGFLPFLLGTLVVAGVLALIGWQAAPWLMPQPSTSRAQVTPSESAKPEQPKVEPPKVEPPNATEPQSTAVPAPAPQTATPPSPDETKPSPLGPSTEAPVIRKEPAPRKEPEPPAPELRQPAQEPLKRERRPVEPPHSGPMQDVTILSTPSGALAKLDGNASTSCNTPCTIPAAPGRHTIFFSAPGYMIESREVMVARSPVEMGPVALRPSTGYLYVTSEPEGATIVINGRKLDQLTPANLPLSPGFYTIAVDKDGRQYTGRVEIKDGVTTYQRVKLN